MFGPWFGRSPTNSGSLTDAEVNHLVNVMT